MDKENQKVVLIRVPPFMDERQEKKIEETVSILEENFPNRKIIKIPMEFGIEFLND